MSHAHVDLLDKSGSGEPTLHTSPSTSVVQGRLAGISHGTRDATDVVQVPEKARQEKEQIVRIAPHPHRTSEKNSLIRPKL